MNDPNIVVNGMPLTTGQAIAVQVAVANFLSLLEVEDFIKDLGEIGPAYQARLREVIHLMDRQ